MNQIDFNRKQGQLHPEERELLYNAVIDLRPANVIEMGSWGGDSSTYFIAEALKANKFGMCYSVEIDPNMWPIIRNNLKQNDQEDVVTFIGGDFYHKFLSDIDPHLIIGGPTIVFLDGPDSAKICYDAFKIVDMNLVQGDLVIIHDWKGLNSDPRQNKATLIKEKYTDMRYVMKIELDSLVGICVLEKQGNIIW